MAFNSITRLRLRSVFTLPAFFRDAQASSLHAGRSAGFISGALLLEGRMVSWTRTAWESEEAMKSYRDSDEPVSDWDEIYRRMGAEGRLSRVRHPTDAHTAKRFAPMRRWIPEQPIKPSL